MSPPTDSQSVGAPSRAVFFVSDGTGITVETLGHSLLSQFESLRFHYFIIPFVTTEEKAREAVERINVQAAESGLTPVVFFSMVDERLREIVESARALTLDFFSAFLGRIENELGTLSNHTLGRAHGMHDAAGYLRRIEAVNFSLAADDGLNTQRYPQAQVILVGLSRVGKTPTSLYLALQFGIFAANYPLTENDLEAAMLPAALAAHRERLFGLSISSQRLIRIRVERRPGSAYADPARVRREVENCERLLHAEGIPVLDTTAISVEEIAATILYQMNLTPPLL